ncbi:TATA box-binding protein-associated factor RNA polymerase I subunit B [Haematobia irritans]|uniref:TATA box-binding protein-associated factor RNA polymerase I subunit B n=1 Tax=Haematobia irritans TaxID=7368 RepID=UPI003F50A5E3
MEDVAIPNISCTVCGENEFEQREGFYFCLECGTKQEQVRQVEVENEDDAFNETAGTKLSKTMKINVVKAEKPQLTSWEFYNYILRGYVQELLEFGAKEELKLMALQVWAAYLRRMEVAFFNKKHADLPKLGIRYLKNDAETIYNHTKLKRKRRKSANDTSCTSGGEDMSTRSWRRAKRKLNESLYSSATSATSTSANSNKAIKLSFNMKARKYLKKRMPVKHLLRHEMDSEGLLQCHSQPNSTELKRREYCLTVMNIRQIYSILAIALNLIGDDLQLTDLRRFIYEDHIASKNIFQYFPENIAPNVTEILKKVEFHRFSEKCIDKNFRQHVGLFAKNIGIRNFTTPNIVELVQRYVSELCLPQEVRIYAERLINFLPPCFKTRGSNQYPDYEARAMAYIIFILKLLFGLDGCKERQISSANMKLNRKIEELNRKNKENRPLLFVWTEWQRYIEMRKIIVSYYNQAFCKQFKQRESTEQILEQMTDDIQRREELAQSYNTVSSHPIIKQKLDSLKVILENFLENYKTRENDADLDTDVSMSQAKIIFKPTYTPALTYFKTILLHRDNLNTQYGVIPTIPHFMHTDHTKRDMQSYLEVKPLIEYFRNNNIDLQVSCLETTNNRNYTGIFLCTRKIYDCRKQQKANFNITDMEWIKNISNHISANEDDLAWITDDQTAISKKKKKTSMSSNNYCTKTHCEQTNTSSIDVFSECNMDPLPTFNNIKKPRRNLGIVDIFADIDDEDYLYDNLEPHMDHSNTNHNNSSRPMTPMSIGEIYIKSEFITETTTPPNIEPETLKFLNSNMDCWMLLGNMLPLTTGQHLQVRDKLPKGFFWLLETCAQTLDVDWPVVYEQLLIIELMFCMGVEDLNDVKDCVYLKSEKSLTEYRDMIKSLRDIW